MEITVVKIQELEGKYGKSKKLTCVDGTVYNVKPKNETLYATFTAPGKYKIQTAEFNGHPYIKDAVIVGGQAAAVKLPPKAAAVNQDDRQLDIIIECYASIAEKALEHNGVKEITPKMIMNFAKDMMMMHAEIKELKAQHVLGGFGKDYDIAVKEAMDVKREIEEPTAGSESAPEVW